MRVTLRVATVRKQRPGYTVFTGKAIDKDGRLLDARSFYVVNRERVVLVTGGAGVGKTTVLKAMYRLFDAAGIEVVQMALAGRAAKRMQEATGRPARTIASFIRDTTEGALPQVVLLGDVTAARTAVEKPPRSTTRQVALDLTVQRMLKAIAEDSKSLSMSPVIPP